jgi:hypothetical protein
MSEESAQDSTGHNTGASPGNQCALSYNPNNGNRYPRYHSTITAFLLPAAGSLRVSKRRTSAPYPCHVSGARARPCGLSPCGSGVSGASFPIRRPCHHLSRCTRPSLQILQILQIALQSCVGLCLSRSLSDRLCKDCCTPDAGADLGLERQHDWTALTRMDCTPSATDWPCSFRNYGRPNVRVRRETMTLSDPTDWPCTFRRTGAPSPTGSVTENGRLHPPKNET